MAGNKLNEDEKLTMQKALKEAALSERDIVRLADGDAEGEDSVRVDSEDDLISAAATALEFVEGLDSPEARSRSIIEEASTSEGFDALLEKLEAMRGDIAALQRGVVGIFAAQLLAFRGKVVDLKTIISTDMVEKLRMPMFRNVIESTFVDIVDSEFSTMEKELVDKIVDETQERFKEFAQRVRETETALRETIAQQQDVVRSFMQSLEEEAFASGDTLKAKDLEIQRLEQKIRELQKELDKTRTIDVVEEEMKRQIADMEADISDLREQLFKRGEILEARTKERDAARAEIEEYKMQLAEAQTQLEVYKKATSKKEKVPAVDTAEIKALEAKINLLEKTLEEKRQENDELNSKIKEMERSMTTLQKENKSLQKESERLVKEIEGMHGKISEVRDLEQRIYDLENELREAESKVSVVEMQREAFEKATRLMEKERDMSLQLRDLAEERAKRYIKVLGVDASTKVLLLVDEVGKMTFADLGKALGIASGLAAKHARALEKLGVLKIEGDTAISTLKDFEIEEGEVKLD